MIIKKETSYQISSIINVLREWSTFDEGCSILCQFIEVGKKIKLIPNPLPLSSFYCFFPMLDLNFIVLQGTRINLVGVGGKIGEENRTV